MNDNIAKGPVTGQERALDTGRLEFRDGTLRFGGIDARIARLDRGSGHLVPVSELDTGMLRFLFDAILEKIPDGVKAGKDEPEREYAALVAVPGILGQAGLEPGPGRAENVRLALDALRDCMDLAAEPLARPEGYPDRSLHRVLKSEGYDAERDALLVSSTYLDALAGFLRYPVLRPAPESGRGFLG